MTPKYWFKPKRVGWKFAAYYPSSWEGWSVTLAILAALVYTFQDIDKQSGSIFDTLIVFAPRLIGLLIIFDIFTRAKGEYPSWWRGWKWRK